MVPIFQIHLIMCIYRLYFIKFYLSFFRNTYIFVDIYWSCCLYLILFRILYPRYQIRLTCSNTFWFTTILRSNRVAISSDCANNSIDVVYKWAFATNIVFMHLCGWYIYAWICSFSIIWLNHLYICWTGLVTRCNIFGLLIALYVFFKRLSVTFTKCLGVDSALHY